jgi:hypothetical protein
LKNFYIQSLHQPETRMPLKIYVKTIISIKPQKIKTMPYYTPTFNESSFHYVYNRSENNLSVIADVNVELKPKESLQAKPVFNSGTNTARKDYTYTAGSSLKDPVIFLDKTPVVVIPKIDIPFDETKPEEFKKAVRAKYPLGYKLEANVPKSPDGTVGGQATKSISKDADIEII